MKHNNDMILDHCKILALIPSMVEDMKVLREKLIDGNGEAGLLQKHASLSTGFKDHIIEHDKYISGKKWFVGLCVVVALSVIGVFYAEYKNDKRMILKKIEEVGK